MHFSVTVHCLKLGACVRECVGVCDHVCVRECVRPCVHECVRVVVKGGSTSVRGDQKPNSTLGPGEKRK